MRIELTTKSGLSLSGELKSGGSIIELRIYQPTTELVQCLQQHRINFSVHETLSSLQNYVFVCLSADKIESYEITEED